MSESWLRLSDEVLLAQREWVLRLARAVLHDRDLAEDAAQETWLRYLRAAPAALADLRSWLATVLNNVARTTGRREQRRAVGERAAARPEVGPSSAEIVERIAIQRHVAGIVLGVREPYRTVLLLRFYEELEPRHIAARLHLPVETVRTRLKRALVLVRGELERASGAEPTDWLGALALWVEAEGAGAAA